jgi:hypothetical protein
VATTALAAKVKVNKLKAKENNKKEKKEMKETKPKQSLKPTRFVAEEDRCQYPGGCTKSARGHTKVCMLLPGVYSVLFRTCWYMCRENASFEVLNMLCCDLLYIYSIRDRLTR